MLKNKRGGSFTLMPGKRLKEIIELAHSYNVLVSTGGFIKHVLTQEPEIVSCYSEESLSTTARLSSLNACVREYGVLRAFGVVSLLIKDRAKADGGCNIKGLRLV